MLRVVLLASLLPASVLAQPAAFAPSSAFDTHDGMTFEIDAGLGWIRTSPERAASYTSGVSFALDASVGYWLTPKLVIGGRVAGLSSFEDGEQLGTFVVGPTTQYWIDTKLWVGGGAGAGVLLSSRSDNELGFGLDLRAGFVVSRREDRVFHISLDVTPARFSAAEESAWFTAVAVLVGLQYL